MNTLKTTTTLLLFLTALMFTSVPVHALAENTSQPVNSSDIERETAEFAKSSAEQDMSAEEKNQLFLQKLKDEEVGVIHRSGQVYYVNMEHDKRWDITNELTSEQKAEIDRVMEDTDKSVVSVKVKDSELEISKGMTWFDKWIWLVAMPVFTLAIVALIIGLATH